jgi:pathogenesis-related protein 1
VLSRRIRCTYPTSSGRRLSTAPALALSFLLLAFLGSNAWSTQSRQSRLPVFAQQMLAAHNAVRIRTGVPPLVWSEQLEKYARQWAGTLLSNGDFSHSRNQQYGQNLFEISGGSVTAEEVVSAWVSEAKNYNRQKNTCSGTCGHYTQVVWRDTKKVGCGVARGRRREVWVCDYEPPGNIVGERPY